jgi:hypothetical protein
MDEPQILCGHDHASVFCQNIVSPVETIGQSSTVVVSHLQGLVYWKWVSSITHFHSVCETAGFILH